MANVLLRGLLRPRTYLSLALVGGVAATASGWLYQRMTRVASAYGFVRGEVVLVGASSEGQIATLEVQPGQKVRRGDVLARLQAGGLEAEVARARATHAHANLAVRAERRAIEVERQRIAAVRRRFSAALDARRSEARAAALYARYLRRSATRAEHLADEEALPIADQDAATTLARTAHHQAAQRRAEVRYAEAEVAELLVAEADLAARIERVALLESEADSSQAALAAAEARLDLTRIRAQHDGRVTRTLLAPGASIKLGDPLLEMWLDGPIYVEAWIDEKRLGRLRVGGAVRVSVAGLSETFAGRIEGLGMVTAAEVKDVSVTIPIGNRLAKARWVRMRIALDAPDDRLMPGLTAEVVIPKGSPSADERETAAREGR